MGKRYPGRQRKRKRIKPIIRVFCEGSKTEYHYFSALRGLLKNKHAVLEVVKGRGGDAMKVFRDALHAAQAIPDSEHYPGDQVYVVVDVEPHAIEKVAALRKALDHARDTSVQLAISNPCFEFWLLCHVVDADAAVKTLRTPREADDALKAACQSGKDDIHKHGDRIVPKLLEGLDNAVARAERIEEQHRASNVARIEANPHSEVYRIAKLLQGDTAFEEFLQE